MQDLRIITDEGSKGRSFKASLLAYTTSRVLWDSGQHENIRPIWAMIACSEAESLPLVRNLQSGRKAAISVGRDTKHFECLKSAGYEYHPQRHPEGVLWTIFLPSLYRIDPGMIDPESIRFALAPAHEWLSPEDEQTAQWLADRYRSNETWQADKEHEKRLTACRHITRASRLFCNYLDRRTRCPLIPESRFYSLVLAALIDSGQATFGFKEERYSYRQEWAHGRFSYVEEGLESVGLAPGIACNTTHEKIEPILAECVKVYEREMRLAA